MANVLNIPELGDPAAGRPNLGETTSVTIFRVVRNLAMGNALKTLVGEDRANEFLYHSGQTVGAALHNKLLTDVTDLNVFVEKVTTLLEDLGVGRLSIVQAKPDKGLFELKVDECVSCAGVGNLGKVLCYFEAGVISGLLGAFTGKKVRVDETKCWGKGDTTCQFKAKVVG